MPLSCRACRELKRRCDRQKPACALCLRAERECVYPRRKSKAVATVTGHEVSPASSHTAYTAVDSALDLETETDQGNDDVPLLFLDSALARHIRPCAASTVLWKDVAPPELQYDLHQVRTICQAYFEATHSWFPVVSRRRVLRLLSTMHALTKADDGVLLAAMALLSSSLASTKLYDLVKATTATCESAGDISTNLLAAQVLTALHEVGAGLYPAAYYSAGSCIRSCMILGLHNKRTAAALGPKVDAWTEIEERRRLWWASLILDRYVHAGFTFRPLFHPVLDRSEILPADDIAWDGGYISPNSLLVMSFGSTATAAPFARLCQAAHLLGKSCQHAEDRFSAVNIDYHAQEAYSLGRAASSFLALIEQELADTEQGCRHNLYGAFGLCCSALLSLYYIHCCLDDDALTIADSDSKVRDQSIRIELQKFAIAGLATITQTVLDFSVELYAMCEDGRVHQINPLVLNALYQAGKTRAWHARETDEPFYQQGLQQIRRTLRALEEKWACAGQYLQLLEITEKGACEPF